MAVRSALGARFHDLAAIVLRYSARVALAGMLAGSAGVIWLGALLRSLLFGVEPSDPASFALAVGLLLATIAMASGMPLFHALRVDPAEALRLGRN